MSKATESNDTTPTEKSSGCDSADSTATQAFLTDKLVEVLDRYLADLKDGTAPSREDMLATYPELASHLDACLAGINFIQGAGEAVGEGAPRQLADFRILREVGRGGMGAVYEAEQVSLGRRVALKVLRFGAVSDPEALSRFQREAETVANLHHTNIVPIFSVGSENGVNYYAMQFIEGRSLDFVLKETETDLEVKTVAAWGLQAAEALAHAHHRNVIHRDVKPSNLMLDEEDRIWLTDFGLAKRLDDVTLSITGALLGTPRYMSPEQAAATMTGVDHRSDIYSLGATLYELATNKPVFEADTHHAVIGKILEEEPCPPRQHRPDIPHDLETIVLKCLSKDASCRYDSAEELAEDLRAFLKDRPIKARRASMVEISTRWLRQNRKSVTRTAATVAVTVLLLLAAFVGWRSYSQSRLAFLELNSDVPLVAEVTDRRGRTETVTLPTQDPIEVVAGEVRVRVSGDGTLGQTYQTTLAPGQRARYEPHVDAHRPRGSISIRRAHRLFACDDGVDVILMDNDGIHRHDASGGSKLWSLDLAQPTASMLTHEPSLSWPWTGSEPFFVGQIETAELPDSTSNNHTHTSIDLNADGENDVVVAARHQAWLLAVSGKEGEPLWFRGFGSNSKPVSVGGEQTHHNGHSAVLVSPLVLGDINGDGVVDLLVTCGETTKTKELISDHSQRWMEAISGANGATLWQFDLQDGWFDLPTGEEVPYHFRWFPSGNQSLAASGSNGTSRRGGMVFRSKRRTYQSHGFHVQAPDAPHLIGAEAAEATAHRSSAAHEGVIGLVAGTHVVAIDAFTGELLMAEDVNAVAIQPAIWKDMDGDMVADVVFVEQRAGGQLNCTVWSVAKKTMLWEKDITAFAARYADSRDISAAWPLAVDLNGDGAHELILPSDTSDAARARSPRLPWGQIEALRGSDGKRLWARRLIAMDQQIDHFAVGPDLDGDNYREVFAAVLWGDDFELYVEALSGSDGRSLWWSRQSLPPAPRGRIDYVLGPLRWWSPSADGWPQLLVQVHPDNGVGKSKVCALSAATGQLTHTIEGMHTVTPADANGDGTKDLFSFRKFMPTSSPGPAGELEVVPSVAECWRRLAGPRWSILPDVNGDGVRDLITQAPGATARAFSGLEGDLLWETRGDNFNTINFAEDRSVDPSREQKLHAVRDLDGDQVPDLITWQRTGAGSRVITPIRAVSGRTGRNLWAADIDVHVMRGAPLLDIHDLDGNGAPEVIVVAAMDWGYGRRRDYGTNDQQLWLAVLDGRNGSVRWKQPLSAAYGRSSAGGRLPYQFEDLALSTPYVDLNADGVLDLVLPAESSSGAGPLELRAFDGRDGGQLWRHLLPPTTARSPFAKLSRMTPVDLDGDGKLELLCMALEESKGKQGHTLRVHHLVALNADGQVRWRWQADTPRLFDWYHEEPLDRRGPVILRTETDHPLVCLPFTSPSPTTPWQGELTVLDHTGQPVVRRHLDATMGYRIWATDGDRDYVDELILTNVERMLAIDPSRPNETLWKRELGGNDPGSDAKVIGLRLQSDAEPPVLLLRHGAGNNTLEGIDTFTGALRWACPGPTPRNRFGWIRIQTIQLLNEDDALPPQVFFHNGHVAQCRLATRLGITPAPTNGTTPAPGKVTSLRVEPTRQPAPHDPRLIRQLPWNRFLGDVVSLAGTYWISATLYCVSLVLLPVGCIVLLCWRRQWGMRTLALLPVVAAVFLLAYASNGPEPVVFTTPQKFIVAIAFVPVLILLVSFSYWSITKQWRRARFWLVFSAVATISLALLILFLSNTGQEPRFPGERYSLEGWYWICFAGAYFTGWVMLSSVPSTLRAMLPIARTAPARISGHTA